MSTFSRLTAAAMLVGAAFVPALVNGTPAAAAVTGCTFQPTPGGPLGGDGQPLLFQATCTADPTDSWDLAITCIDYRDHVSAPIYGGIKFGSGTGYAECTARNQYLYSWWIRTL
jgi:hypothetical protein